MWCLEIIGYIMRRCMDNIINNKGKLLFIISWIAVLFWMLFIFNLSSQAADQSDKLSIGVTEIIVEAVEKVTPGYDLNIREFNHILRKNAHFFAYLVLGVLVVSALRQSGIKGLRAFALALSICVLYAVSDEVHQLFVPGRGGQAVDVLIDSAGAIFGIVGYMFLRLKKHSNWSKM